MFAVCALPRVLISRDPCIRYGTARLFWSVHAFRLQLLTCLVPMVMCIYVLKSDAVLTGLHHIHVPVAVQQVAAEGAQASHPAHEEEGPATAGAGDSVAVPQLSALQQQWAPEPEEEEDEEEEEENVGQWSPAPLDAQHVGSQDVVHEDDDQRLLDLLRKQVGVCGKMPVIAVNTSIFAFIIAHVVL